MAYRSGQYRPTEEIAFENIEAVWDGEYPDGTPAEHPLGERDKAIVAKAMRSLERRLLKQKRESVRELTGKEPKGVKLQFGGKSNLELMAMLGIYFVRMQEDEPEAWSELLAWARSR